MTRTRTALAAGALLATLVLTGCGGSSGGADGASSQADTASGSMADRSVAGSTGEKAAAPQSGSDSGDAGTGKTDAAAPLVDEQKIVRTAAMTVRTKDVLGAAASVRTAVEQAKGFIADEKTTSAAPGAPATTEDQAGYTQSVLTARVPNDSLDAVMAAVSRTGTVLSRSQSSDDVTSQYVDTQSRVRTQTASVERVRLLLGKATSIGQVVQIESELSRREADLESLEAQLKALENQTTLSTLTVDLSPNAVAPAPTKNEDTGFLAGLSAGWTALLASLTVVLTVLGALLPFLVLLALIGVPVLVWARRQRAARAAGAPPVDPGQPQPQPAP